MDVAPKDFLHRQLQRYGVIGFQFQYAFGRDDYHRQWQRLRSYYFGRLCCRQLSVDVWVPNTFFLIDGSGITVDFQGGQSLLLNHSITTHATVTWTSAAEVPLSTTPLPAALPLFVSGLGAMGLFGWRRKRKTQAAVA